MLELGAFVVITAALVSDLARATPSRALHSEIDVRDVVTEQEALLGAWVARLLARLAIKDASTREHTRRVAQLAVEVGQELGLRGARLRGLAVAALLHDVGKLQVPDDDPRARPAPLTPAEFAVIKRHPGDGAALLDAHRRIRRRGAARARPSRAPRRQRLSRRPARRRAVDRAAHPGRLRRLRRAHERARLPPRLRRVAARWRSSSRARGSSFDPDVLDALARVVGVAPVVELRQAA